MAAWDFSTPFEMTGMERGLRNENWELRDMEITRLFYYKETRCLQLPVMLNEFGVCMVYGRCFTGDDGARQAWVSRHFCPVGNFWSPAFPMAILEIYGMLSFKTAGLFMTLYYINNGRLRFLKKEVKIFFINLYKCMIEGMELSDWQDNPERWSDRR